jgi:hypothetical protein
MILAPLDSTCSPDWLSVNLEVNLEIPFFLFPRHQVVSVAGNFPIPEFNSSNKLSYPRFGLD